MDILNTETLPDGRRVEICRIVTPDATLPEDVVRYFIASLGFDYYREYVNDQNYWRLYYRESLAGRFVPDVIDHHYLARIDGEYAARLWFAYSTRTGHGNFGNVYTEVPFRCLGLMNRLLDHFRADFQTSPATMLCDGSGSEYAVRSYCRFGFRLPYGGTTGMICLCKKGSFQKIAAKAFPGREPTAIRPGGIADQFECDKFRAYTPEMITFPRQTRLGAAAIISDYRIAFQEVLSGNGVILVQETPLGEVPGYAFALRFFGQDILDFGFHLNYLDTLPELLQKTAVAYQHKFSTSPVCVTAEGDVERENALRRASFVEIGGVPGKFRCFSPRFF